MIGVVDYRMGNLGSVLNACAKVGAEARLVSKPEELASCDRIMLPGVGAFPDAMAYLRDQGMDEAIRDFAATGRPLMGTCLGMQLLFEKSHEFGEHAGLGLIPGAVIRFDETRFDRPRKIPHIGWNEMFVQKDSPLFAGLPRDFYLYFVHSYHAVTDEKHIIGTTHYGYEFASAVQRENVYGFQPHPEKSHNHGLKIVENFSKL